MRALFDLFSNDPSKNWVKRIGDQITFNLASESVNGVVIEDAFDSLSVFGRPANRNPFERQFFDYPDLGLVVGGENNRIKYFSFSIQSFSDEVKPCRITLISERGTPVLLGKSTKPEELENVFGKPFEHEKTDEEAAYRYKYKRLILVFEFDEGELALFEAGLEDYV